MLEEIKEDVKPEEIKALSLDPILKQIQETKKLPFEQRDYLYSYFLLENFIVNSDLGCSKADLRLAIKEKFNVKWFSPRIRALFETSEPDRLIFSEVLLEGILKHLIQNINPAAVQRIVNELTKGKLLEGITIKEKIGFSIVNTRIYSKAENFDKVMKEIHELLKALYIYSEHNIGASATKKFFTEAFNELSSKYINFPEFIEALKALPEGILDEERLDLLTKEELEKVSKRLANIDVMKSEFTNIAAHELKTPLIPIKGFLSMMVKDPKKYDLNEKALEYIDICLRNANRLEQLVQDVLDISKLEAGEMKFEMKDVNLIPLLNNTITELFSLAKEKNLILKPEIPKTLPIVYGDSIRLSQVISNLIKNSIKFTDKGSITVNAKVIKNNVQVEVTDTGIGLRKEDMPKLFTKFFQTQDITTRKTKGTGLGLAICKKIIEAHDGKILGNSKGLGKGTTFSFTLPIKDHRPVPHISKKEEIEQAKKKVEKIMEKI